MSRSLRALTASLLTGTSVLVTPAVTAPAVATLVGATWLGSVPAAAQAFLPIGGDGGDSGGNTFGGYGGSGYGCGACGAEPGYGDAAGGGGGGGGGGPNAAGANGGSGAGAGGTGGANPGDNGNVGASAPVAGAGGGGGAGGATGMTTFGNATVTGGAGGVGGAGGGALAAGGYGGGGGGGGAGGYGARFTAPSAIVTNSSFGATGGAGGVGGAGGSGDAAGGNGGDGGGGGGGVWLGSAVKSFTIGTGASITGGNGADGGVGGASGGGFGGNGGRGGIGGAGLIIDGATVTNNGAITGGNAGAGGTGGAGGIFSGADGAPGLSGGLGIFGSRGTIINNGTITGGSSSYFGGFGIGLVNGGAITNGVTGVIQGGAGTGIGYGGGAIIASNATITNRGTIEGGSGAPGGFYGAISGINLTVINSGTITGAGGGAGPAILFQGGSNVLELQAGSAINGLVYGGCACLSNTLRFGGPAFGGIGNAAPPLEFFDLSSIGPLGQYVGFNVFQVTGGTWNFTGTAIQTDPWTISNGVVILSGDLSSASGITLNKNGMLIGDGGALGSLQVNNGGIFAPGDVPGASITITGDLGFASAAVYYVIADAANSSHGDVTGTAALGGKVRAEFTGGGFGPTSYNILTATTVTGKFTGGVLVDNLPAGLFPSLSYTTTDVFLNLTTTAPAVRGLSGNAQNVADAIANSGGAVPSGLASLYGLGNNAFEQASGQPGASSAQSGISSTNTFINTIFDFAFGSGGTGGTGGAPLGYAPQKKVSQQAAEAYAAVTPRDRVPFTARWNMWATGYGGYAQVDGSASAGTATTTSRVWGLVAGAEYRFTPDTKAGFAVGGSTSNFRLDGGFGSGSADAFNLAVYGRHQVGPWYVAGALGYSLQAADTKRTVTILGTDVLEADFTAHVVTARIEGGYRLAMAPVTVTPYAALQSTTFFLPSYGEHATSGANTFALSYDSEAITATRTELGGQFEKVIATGEGIWTLRSKLAWAHDWNTDRQAIATFQSLPGATFTVNGAEPDADAVLVSLGAEYGWGNGWSLEAKFDGEFSGTTESYAGKGTLRYEW